MPQQPAPPPGADEPDPLPPLPLPPTPAPVADGTLHAGVDLLGVGVDVDPRLRIDDRGVDAGVGIDLRSQFPPEHLVGIDDLTGALDVFGNPVIPR